MNNDEVRKYALEFDRKILDALKTKFKDSPREHQKLLIDERTLIKTLSLEKFIDSFLDSGIYPADRLEQSINLMMDIKLQIYFIEEVDLGLYGTIGYSGTTIEGITEYPYLFLKHLSMDQGVILKSRILWERIMNLVYYLETGKMLDVGKSKKKKFTNFIAENPKWQFFNDYIGYIEEYDNQLRTPETHKNSTIRSHFSSGKLLDSDSVLLIINIVANLWQNIVVVISGGQANSRYWSIGMEKLKREIGP